jgi:hypothetical protein
MWMGAIRLDVLTENAPYAGTDNLVTAAIVRNGNSLLKLKLDYPTEDDLERGAERNYDYYNLPWINDKTPPLPPNVAQNPMPYPAHGVEFSNGLHGHLVLGLHIWGDDMWIKDNVDLYMREVKQVATSFDTLGWKEDSQWKYVATWSKDTAMSGDSSEGVTNLNLVLN